MEDETGWAYHACYPTHPVSLALSSLKQRRAGIRIFLNNSDTRMPQTKTQTKEKEGPRKMKKGREKKKRGRIYR
jgi:hypothetical protein